jgi:DNA repair exonuclease SbcCD ATPase subunit
MLRTEQSSYENLSIDLEKILREIKDEENNLTNKNKQVSLLNEVPCGSEFSHCKFIRGAYEAQGQVDIIKLSIQNNKKVSSGINEKIKTINPDKIEQQIKKFDELVEMTKTLENNIAADTLIIENLNSRKSILKHELKDLKQKEKLYEENKEVIEDLGGVVLQKNQKQNLFQDSKDRLNKCEKILFNLYKAHGYLEQRIESLREKQRNLKSYQNDFEAFDLYARCMHPNGIAYDIIKKSLPTINSEISKILANIVDFQVYFETEDNRLDIYIQQPDRDASPLEMASGAEKTVAAMAIRLAFTNISSLPKSQIFVLDEPGTALDEERMEGFVRILDITTSVFKTVILISHLDNLKDSADSIINIENKNGYANVVA